MRYIELVCLSLIFAIFSALFRSQLFQLSGIDSSLSKMKKKTDSLTFISTSFRNTCQGKGFSSLDEWKSVCADMWNLETIEWTYVGNSENAEDGFFCGKWEGPSGSGEVYAEQ